MLVGEKLKTNTVYGVQCVESTQYYRTVTNFVDGVAVELNGTTNVFTRPIALAPGREYRVTGPGVLDAELVASSGAVTVRVARCILRSRGNIPLDERGVFYSLEGGAALEFPELPRPLRGTDRILLFDGSCGRRFCL